MKFIIVYIWCTLCWIQAVCFGWLGARQKWSSTCWNQTSLETETFECVRCWHRYHPSGRVREGFQQTHSIKATSGWWYKRFSLLTHRWEEKPRNVMDSSDVDRYSTALQACAELTSYDAITALQACAELTSYDAMVLLGKEVATLYTCVSRT